MSGRRDRAERQQGAPVRPAAQAGTQPRAAAVGDAQVGTRACPLGSDTRLHWVQQSHQTPAPSFPHKSENNTIHTVSDGAHDADRPVVN